MARPPATGRAAMAERAAPPAPPLVDAEARSIITSALDRTLFVEAGAGSTVTNDAGSITAGTAGSSIIRADRTGGRARRTEG